MLRSHLAKRAGSSKISSRSLNNNRGGDGAAPSSMECKSMEPTQPAVANIYPLKFFTRYSYDGGGNVTDEVEWCLWGKKGVRNPTTTPQRVKDIKRHDAKWAALEPYYRQWKQGKDLAAQGTPLEAWPALSEEERKLLQAEKIYTLEEFASLSDNFVGEISFPGVHKKRDDAKRFIAVRDEQENVSELQQRIKELEAQVHAGEKPAGFSAVRRTNPEKQDQDEEKKELRAKLTALNIRAGGRCSVQKLRQMVAEAGLDEPVDNSS